MITFKCYVYEWNRMPKLPRTEWILWVNCLKKANLFSCFHEGISLCETPKPASAEKSFLLSFTASSSWMLDDWNTSAGKQNETQLNEMLPLQWFLFFSLEYLSAVCKIQAREFLLFFLILLKKGSKKNLVTDTKAELLPTESVIFADTTRCNSNSLNYCLLQDYSLCVVDRNQAKWVAPSNKLIPAPSNLNYSNWQ